MGHPPYKEVLVTYSLYNLPIYMFLDLSRGIICSVARFRLCAHTLQVATVTWTHNTSSLLVICAMLMTYKISSASFFTASIHTRSLSAGLMRL